MLPIHFLSNKLGFFSMLTAGRSFDPENDTASSSLHPPAKVENLVKKNERFLSLEGRLPNFLAEKTKKRSVHSFNHNVQ